MSGEGWARSGLALPIVLLLATSKRFPREKFPKGHRILAATLQNQGMMYKALGKTEEAVRHHQQALAMHQALIPRGRFPHGHPVLVACLGQLAQLFRAQGKKERARAHFQQGLEMAQRLYPGEKYPTGHPTLANLHNNWGAAAPMRGESACENAPIQLPSTDVSGIVPRHERKPPSTPRGKEA